jgi:hypothetical protein
MRQPAGQLVRGIGHAPTREGDFHSALPGNDQRSLALSLIRICIVLLCIAQSPRTGVPQLAQRSCICSPGISARSRSCSDFLWETGGILGAVLGFLSLLMAMLLYTMTRPQHSAGFFSKENRERNRDTVHLKRCRIVLLTRSGIKAR